MLRCKIKDDETGVAKSAAHIIQETIRQNNRLGKPTVLGLATGSTPLPLYKELIRLHQEEGLDFSRVITFNLDEYQGLPPNHPQSYHYYMHENFFKHVNIQKENIHLLDGTLTQPEAVHEHLLDYEMKIKKVGGIDIQVLGLGGNGHIAFNEPGSAFNSKTRVVNLDQKTRADNARFFSNLSEVPTQALTRGIGPILEAKQCLLLATGLQKAEIVKRVLNTRKATETIPATVLHQHSNTVLLLIDRFAAREFEKEWRTKALLFARQYQKTKPTHLRGLGIEPNFLSARL